MTTNTSSSIMTLRQDFFRFHSFSDIGENEIDHDELAPVKTFLHTIFESRIQLYLSATAKGLFFILFLFDARLKSTCFCF